MSKGPSRVCFTSSFTAIDGLFANGMIGTDVDRVKGFKSCLLTIKEILS